MMFLFLDCGKYSQHPILEEVFVHSKLYAVSFFSYHKHCSSYGVSWQIQFLGYKATVLGEDDKKDAVFYFQWIHVVIGIIWSMVP